MTQGIQLPGTVKILLALHLAEPTGWALACPASGITSGSERWVKRLPDGRLDVQRLYHWLSECHSLAQGLERVVFNAMGRYLTLPMAQAYGALWGQLAAFCDPRGITCLSVSRAVRQQYLMGRSGRSCLSQHHPVDWIAALQRRGFAPEHENEAQALATLLWALETQGVRHEN